MKKFSFSECMEEHDGYAATEDNRAVRLFCNDFRSCESNPPVVVGVLKQDKRDILLYFEQDGKRCNYSNSPYNLFTPSKRIKRTYWTNIYPESRNCTGLKWISRSEARKHAGIDVLACVEVTIDCFEGEGLD